MADADFISFGDIDSKQSLDGSKEKRPRALRPPSHQAGTKEERKAIAREIRLKAKREHKKAKADAKRQRKENAIMNRRMTKNPEKYNKNAARNRLRAIDLERTGIRSEAVRQAERLAAKHDPSGRSFNVGPVIVLDDGRVKSKEAFERAEEARLARERGGGVGEGANVNVNPERAAQINPKVSKKQQKKQAALQPSPAPPKPTIPTGVSLPEGEENWLALWDVDDAEIEKRIAKQKNEKKKAAKALRRKQQEQKKFNRALKVKKKEAANKGVLFDPELAKKEILGELSEEEKENGKKEDQTKAEKSSSEDSDSDSSSGDSSDSDSDSDSDGGVKIEEPSSKPKRKRSVSEPTSDEPAAKKSKSEDTPKKKHTNRPKLNLSILDPADIDARVKKEQHRLKLDAKRIAKLEKNIAAGDPKTLAAVGLIKKKGRKKEETPEERDERRRKRAEKKAAIEAKRADPVEQERRERLREGYKLKKEQKKAEKREARRLEKIKKAEEKRKKSGWGKEKKRTSSTGATGAKQWNPDALGGDAARKDKFLRLLGAGKSNANGEASGPAGKPKPKVDIEKVQSELERQYDAGMKMKHDGGGKRRGLGA